MSIVATNRSTSNQIPPDLAQLARTLAAQNKPLRGWAGRLADADARSRLLAETPLNDRAQQAFNLALGVYMTARAEGGRR